MLSAFVLFLLFNLCVILVGAIHQARKSPEQQHLDFLVDVGDPYADAYRDKIFGPIEYVPINPKYW